MGLLSKVVQRLFGKTAIDSLDLNQGAWYIDDVAVTATAAQLNKGWTVDNLSVTKAMLNTNVAGVTMTGGNGTALNINAAKIHGSIIPGTGIGVNLPLPGISVGDILVSATAMKMSTGAYVRTTEYTVGNNELIKVAGSNDTDKQIAVNWVEAS